MIMLESVEWFDLQHNFFIFDKAKALPMTIWTKNNIIYVIMGETQ